MVRSVTAQSIHSRLDQNQSQQAPSAGNGRVSLPQTMKLFEVIRVSGMKTVRNASLHAGEVLRSPIE